MNLQNIGRTEILIAVGVAVVLALLLIPLLLGGGYDAKRAEVPLIVDEIKVAEDTIHDAYDEYYSAKSAPRAPEQVDGNTVPWAPSPGFTRLAFEPSITDLRGSYAVAARDDGYTVIGTCDVDSDGRRATFEATHEQAATARTPDEVY